METGFVSSAFDSRRRMRGKLVNPEEMNDDLRPEYDFGFSKRAYPTWLGLLASAPTANTMVRVNIDDICPHVLTFRICTHKAFVFLLGYIYIAINITAVKNDF